MNFFKSTTAFVGCVAFCIITIFGGLLSAKARGESSLVCELSAALNQGGQLVANCYGECGGIPCEEVEVNYIPEQEPPVGENLEHWDWTCACDVDLACAPRISVYENDSSPVYVVHCDNQSCGKACNPYHPTSTTSVTLCLCE